MIQPGDKAPPFALKNQLNQTLRLADFKGKWLVLYFYPKDDTPGCTTQACDFTANLLQFEKLDAAVLGCSPDSPESHRRFIDKHNLKITLLSDPDHKVMETYAAWGEKNMYGKITQGVIRSTVIIDPAGRIAHHYKRVKSTGHADKVAEKLAELRDNA